jgi:hypothetical protein
MSKIDVDFGGWMQEAFDLYKRNFAVLLLVNLIAAVLSSLTVGVLSGPLYAGVCIVTLALLDRREPAPQVGEVFEGMKFFLPSFLFMLILGVVAIVGYLILAATCILIPLIPVGMMFLMGVTMFSLFLIVEQRLDAWQSIVRSFEMVKQSFWPLIALSILASLAGSVGGFLCGVGAFLTMPFYYCALAVAYRKMTSAPAAPGPAPEGEPLVRISPPPPPPAA